MVVASASGVGVGVLARGGAWLRELRWLVDEQPERVGYDAGDDADGADSGGAAEAEAEERGDGREAAASAGRGDLDTGGDVGRLGAMEELGDALLEVRQAAGGLDRRAGLGERVEQAFLFVAGRLRRQQEARPEQRGAAELATGGGRGPRRGRRCSGGGAAGSRAIWRAVAVPQRERLDDRREALALLARLDPLVDAR